MTTTYPISTPLPLTINASTIASGQNILPIDRIKLFSPNEWENFILEWAESLTSEYQKVERCGGAGDMGRDIIATVSSDANNFVWDNYQCKHYGHALHPSDIWLELGKLVYYTYIKKFTLPRKYFFIAPQGAGTSLSNLLREPEKLRQKLLQNWDDKCKTKITQTTQVNLDTKFKTYINNLDFSIITYIPPLRIIDGHRKTSYYIPRFGGGLPDRPTPQSPPHSPDNSELIYISKLIDAYGDHLQRDVSCITDIESEFDLVDHYKDSRIQFYSAESLRVFSRDSLPLGEFKKLQDEIHDGIKDEIRGNQPNGYIRLKEVVKTARNLQITAHSLITVLTQRDRAGICHQLANEDDNVQWVKKS